MMDAELLEKATAAILGGGYVPPELAGEHAEAVLRVAIAACAEICAAERERLTEIIRTGGFTEAVDALPRAFQAKTDEHLIRALLTAAEAAAPLPDAS